MLQSELGDRLRYAQRLTEVELHRPPRRHRAKTAGACADVAEDHERCRAPVPAVEDVGAARFLADGVQLCALHDLLELLEIFALGHPHPNPLRDRGRPKRFRGAHSRMLPAVHSSSRFLTVFRNWPAIMPSMIRWSK